MRFSPKNAKVWTGSWLKHAKTYCSDWLQADLLFASRLTSAYQIAALSCAPELEPKTINVQNQKLK